MNRTDGELFSKTTFNVDSLENTMVEIQQEASSQHSLLKELKERHAKLKEDLQRKTMELQDRKEKKMTISENLKLEEFRIKEVEETYQSELIVTEASRGEVKKVQEKLQAEKDNQIESLKMYEKKMGVLAQSFREGPQHYDRKNMTQKIRNLELVSAGLQKEIDNNEKKLNDFINRFNNMAMEGATFNKSSSYLLNQLEEDLDRIMNKESPFLQKAMESLDKLIADQKKRELNNNKTLEE